MAEGWAKKLLGEQIEAYSAGTDLHPLNRRAVAVMKEVGIDISSHFPKLAQSLEHVAFDLIVTVCDNAAQNCPLPPKGMRLLHIPFDDPPKLAASVKSEEETLAIYRRVRDEIKQCILTLPSLIEGKLQ